MNQVREFNHIKRIHCTGDVINGEIYESLTVDTDSKMGRKKPYFKINEVRGISDSGKEITKSVKANFTMDQIKEFKNELEQVIDRMEKEF